MKRATKPKRRTAPRKARGLTWDERLQAAQLERMADMLLAIPFSPGPKPDSPLFHPGRDVPLRPLMLPDADRWAIADYLRSLTRPRVLKALRNAQTPPKRRGPRADTAQLWKAALDLQMHPDRAKDVAHEWGLSKSRLYEIHAQLAKRSERRLPGDWWYWVDHALSVFKAAHADIQPGANRAVFVEYLRSVR